MTYERLAIEYFGTQLLESGDLDPVYIALDGAALPPDQLKRWLLAYWCLYSVGEASWLSEREGSEFWASLQTAARNEAAAPPGGRWARGKERRHFRGKAALRAVELLQMQYGGRPEGMVEYCSQWSPDDSPITCKKIMGRVKDHHLFGDWIAFKVADMVERVLHVPVDFNESEVFMFDTPREAALMLFAAASKLPSGAKIRDEKAAITKVVEYLTRHFDHRKAPPAMDRPIGLQEVETILCKWKSHLNGHYPLNNDIHEVRHALERYVEHSATARRLLDSAPRVK